MLHDRPLHQAQRWLTYRRRWASVSFRPVWHPAAFIRVVCNDIPATGCSEKD
jgi:hypothetical protein